MIGDTQAVMFSYTFTACTCDLSGAAPIGAIDTCVSLRLLKPPLGIVDPPSIACD